MDAFGLRKVASFLDIVEISKELDPFTKRFRTVDLLDLTLDLGRVLVGWNATMVCSLKLTDFSRSFLSNTSGTRGSGGGARNVPLNFVLGFSIVVASDKRVC